MIRGMGSLVAAVVLASPAVAQTARLPIAEGIWVVTKTPCAAATNVFAHAGGRFGSVYFYGPNQSMGPSDETEVVQRVSRSANGFTIVNEGPLEVSARPNAQAIVRANSPTQGVQWSETVRLCPAATLPAKTRAAIVRLGLAAKK